MAFLSLLSTDLKTAQTCRLVCLPSCQQLLCIAMQEKPMAKSFYYDFVVTKSQLAAPWQFLPRSLMFAFICTSINTHLSMHSSYRFIHLVICSCIHLFIPSITCHLLFMQPWPFNWTLRLAAWPFNWLHGHSIGPSNWGLQLAAWPFNWLHGHSIGCMAIQLGPSIGCMAP